MGLDADLSKYKISNISLFDRENYVDWRGNYYCNILNKNDEKWRDFETELFDTSDRMLNSIIMSSIKETTGDTYSEEGASMFNLDTLNLVIAKLKKAIKDEYYVGYEILIKGYYKDELTELLEMLKNESLDLTNNQYVYLYHATY